MVYFNVTLFFIQSTFRNVVSSTKVVFSSVDFRLYGIFFAAWVPLGINEIFHLGLWLIYCNRF